MLCTENLMVRKYLTIQAVRKTFTIILGPLAKTIVGNNKTFVDCSKLAKGFTLIFSFSSEIWQDLYIL